MLSLLVWAGLTACGTLAAEYRSYTSVEVFEDDVGLDCRRGQVVRATRVSAGAASLVCADPPKLSCSGLASFSGTGGFNRALRRGASCPRNSLAAKGRCGLAKAYLSKMSGPLHSGGGLSSCCQMVGGPAHAESCRSVIVAPGGGGRFRKGPGRGDFEAVKAVRRLSRGRVMLTLCEIHCPPVKPIANRRALEICFPGDASVETPSGSRPMRQLRIGDQVMAAGQGGVGLCPIKAFHHADAETSARFLALSTSSGHRIRLSHRHLIFSPPQGCEGLSTDSFDNFDGGAFRFAARLVVGDCLFVRRDDGDYEFANVTEIEEVKDVGVFAPITECGTVIVDGVLASSYASFESQSAMHTFSSMAHSLSGLFSADGGSVGIPGPLQLFLSLGRLAVPAMSL